MLCYFYEGTLKLLTFPGNFLCQDPVTGGWEEAPGTTRYLAGQLGSHW